MCLNKHFCNYFFLFFSSSFLVTSNLQAQSIPKKEYKNPPTKFNFNIEYGLSTPKIKNSPSLTITNTATSTNEASIVPEKRVYFEGIEPSIYISLGVNYNVFSKLSIGLVTKYTDRYTYNSSLQFEQKINITQNNLWFTSLGSYKQEAEIQHTAFLITTEYNLFKHQFSKHTSATFNIGISGGISLYYIKTGIPNADLQIHVKKNFGLEDTYKLGPGVVEPEATSYNTTTWQFMTGIGINSKKLPSMLVGFRISTLGNFTIMKRPESDRDIFNISTLNIQNTDVTKLDLSLQTTNQERKIISTEFFIRIYAW